MLMIQSLYQNLGMNYNVLLAWKNIVQKINYRLMSTKAKILVFSRGKIRNKPKMYCAQQLLEVTCIYEYTLSHLTELSNLLLKCI